jgi:hypothetical protein
MINEIRNTVEGAAVLKDWLGEGGTPVSQELAERRATTCVCCNRNVAPRWWEKMMNRIAVAIRQQLSVKQKCEIKTSLDDDLHMCQICGCCLQLKVHVPVKHVADHTRPEMLDKMPSYCWIRGEIKDLQ